MRGDGFRVAKAVELVNDRDRRHLFFPSALFDEHPWDMLLHLFIAMFDNEMMEEERLLGLVRASPETGRRWLGYLVKASHVEARDDGDGVVLTGDTVARLRGYLGPVENRVTA